MSEPFDQSLYDAVMSAIPDFDLSDRPDICKSAWDYSARTSARLAAERQATVPTDEALGEIAYFAAAKTYAANDPDDGFDHPNWERLPDIDPLAQQAHIDAARAVRDALTTTAPRVPELPEGWW